MSPGGSDGAIEPGRFGTGKSRASVATLKTGSQGCLLVGKG